MNTPQNPQLHKHSVMPRLFFPKWSKWHTLHVYYFDYYAHIVMARKHRKNGLIQFKTIKVNNSMNVGNPIQCQEYNFNETFPRFLNEA